MARYKGKGHKLPPGIEVRIQESVLRRLIDDKVIAMKAESSQVVVTAAELDTKFQEHKARFRTEEAFQDYLKRSNNTEDNMKKDLQRNMLRDRVVEKLSGAIEIGDEEVTKYYQENLKRFIQKEQVKASRILVRVSPKATDAEKADAMKKAKAVRKKAAKKGADFAALAKEFSNAPEAGRGGALGWLSKGRMPPEFDKVAFELKPGAVSGVTETRLGYEVIFVEEQKEERQRPFVEVEANIKNSLVARRRNQKRREVLRELKATAQVDQIIKFERPKAQTAAANKPVAKPGANVKGPTTVAPMKNMNIKAPKKPIDIPAPKIAEPKVGGVKPAE
jgi:parvulin-like peptidyl-prolyl isomerase